MPNLTQLNDQKRILIDDLRASVRYTPDQETDLLAFMRQYIKEDAERRPAILENIRRCMDGKPYPNPYAAQRCYGSEDVDRLDRLLTEFLDGLAGCSGNEKALDRRTHELIDAIDRLNVDCGYALIDDWRQAKLCALLDDAKALVLRGPTLEMR